MEEQFSGPVVLRRAEYDVEFDLPRASCFSTGDDASESGAALFNATFVHLHFLERIFVDEVQSAAASISTLVSRKPSTIEFKTKAAGARTDLSLGSSSAVKVIAMSFQGYIAATWLTSARSCNALLRRLLEGLEDHKNVEI